MTVIPQSPAAADVELFTIRLAGAGKGSILVYVSGETLHVKHSSGNGVAVSAAGVTVTGQPATSVAFTPAGDLVATDVQAALVELDARVTVLEAP